MNTTVRKLLKSVYNTFANVLVEIKLVPFFIDCKIYDGDIQQQTTSYV